MSESTQPDRAAAPADTPADSAYRDLLDHVTACPRCAANWRTCPTRRVLTATLRKVRP